MRTIIFGATGMVGQGVLRECLLDPEVERVVSIGRSATGNEDPKLREIVRKNLWDFEDIKDSLVGFDACFFCLGVSSSGMKEEEYERVTFGFTVAAAKILSALNPQMTFVFVSGAGADSSEKGRIMWARIKGKTENAILEMPFKAAYVLRPGVIQPLHGIKSRTALYRIGYTLMKPFLSLLRSAFPNYVLTTEDMCQAMLKLARNSSQKRVLESRDIRAILN